MKRNSTLFMQSWFTLFKRPAQIQHYEYLCKQRRLISVRVIASKASHTRFNNWFDNYIKQSRYHTYRLHSLSRKIKWNCANIHQRWEWLVIQPWTINPISIKYHEKLAIGWEFKGLGRINQHTINQCRYPSLIIGHSSESWQLSSLWMKMNFIRDVCKKQQHRNR